MSINTSEAIMLNDNEATEKKHTQSNVEMNVYNENESNEIKVTSGWLESAQKPTITNQ